MSLNDMMAREKLADFRCIVPEIFSGCKGDDCICARECIYLPIFREHMLLRAFTQTFLNGRDVAAAVRDLRELRELPPDMPDYEEGGRAWRFYNGLADRLEAVDKA